MNRRTTIVLFYLGVTLISVGILWFSISLQKKAPVPDLAKIVNEGKQTPPTWFQIQKDLEGRNQAGAAVKLSDLKGKVWLVAEFFAICPHCAVRNGAELRKIYDQFKDHPDFHMVCVTVDPEEDTQEKLSDYAKALSADVGNWWFMNAGELNQTHAYLEQELKFFGVRKRTLPADIEAHGKYAHDLGFILVNREMQVVGKWPLADARSEEARKTQPELYDRLQKELMDRIHAELHSNVTK